MALQKDVISSMQDACNSNNPTEVVVPEHSGMFCVVRRICKHVEKALGKDYTGLQSHAL